MAIDAKPSTLAAALAYAQLGWHVFPVRGSTGGPGEWKRPLPGLAWSQESTTDPKKIAAWFAGSSGIGIGVDLGPSGLMVVDVDRTDLFDIKDSLLTGAWRYQGNRERMSYMFTAPTTTGMVQARHPWGELKATGGYVVVPPSPHEVSGAYQWLDMPGEAPAQASIGLLALVSPKASRSAQGVPYSGTKATDEEVSGILDLLGRLADKIAACGVGGRNTELNTAALIIGHYVPHVVDKQVVEQALLAAAEHSGLIRDDGMASVVATIASGLRKGMSEPLKPLVSGGSVLLVNEGAPSEALFDSSSVLAHIRTAARSRLVSPWAVLGSVLALVVAECPPRLVLPATIGSHASLGLFVGLVGSSGDAKSSAFGVARDVLGGTGHKAKVVGAGSGEGLIDAFMVWDSALRANVLKVDPHVLLYVDEIEQLGAVQGRRGSTIASILRTMWNGQTTGTQNSNAGGRSRNLERHTYRLAVVGGVQPKRADVLFDDSAGGTPQRWVWLPARDPLICSPDDRPAWPGTLDWRMPTLSGHLGDLQEVQVPIEVQNIIAKAHFDRQRFGEEAETMDGHLLLVQLKVAAAMALLHGDIDMTIQHWAMAGMLMDVSGMVRERINVALQRSRAEVQAGRGRDDAVRQSSKDAVLLEREVGWALLAARVVQGPRNHAIATHGDDGCTMRCITYAVRNHHKKGATGKRAVELAIELGMVVRDGDRFLPGEVPWNELSA